MTWFEAIPALTVAVLTVLLIGAPFAWAVGARGITFLGLSVASSVSAIVASSFLAPLAGVPWNLLTPFLVSLPLAAIGFALRRRLVMPPRPDRQSESRSTLLAGLGAVALGSVLIAASVLPAMGHPDSPSQTYDAIFHLNAVQWILDTSDASPIHMTMTTPASSTTFYPTSWHAFVALIVHASGATIVVATNAAAVTTAALIWPIACVFLARVLFGTRRLALLLAGALSAAFGSFPLLLLGFGVLYPNLLAFALLPIALGLLTMALRQDRDSPLTPLAAWLLTLWVVFGMSVAHPNALFSFFALSAPLLVQGCVSYVRRPTPGRGVRGRKAAAMTALLGAFSLEALLWTRIGTNDNAWRPLRTFPVSIAEAVMNGPGDLRVALAVSVFALVGVAATFFQRRFLWLAGSYAIAILLFGVANGAPVGPLRDAITGLWYNDSFRLAALVPVVAVPLAVVGLLTMAAWVIRLVRRFQAGHASPPTRRADASVAVACLALAVLATQPGVAQATRNLALKHQMNEASPLLSPSERRFFNEVARRVPPGSVIAGNPWNGSSLVYAYTGRPALFAHVGGSYDEEYWDFAAGLAQGTPEACKAASDLHVRYVLDFGDNYVFPGDPRAARFLGLTSIENSRVLTPLAEQADLALYEITGCAVS